VPQKKPGQPGSERHAVSCESMEAGDEALSEF
jgi:hypothetical protein